MSTPVTTRAPVSGSDRTAATDERRRELEVAFHRLVGRAWSADNRVVVHRNGEEIFPAMLDAIASARSEVVFVTFVYWGGPIAHRFAEAFAKAARRGVAVTVILDGIGSDAIAPHALETMEAAGVGVHWYHPKRPFWLGSINRRTHRKILVVDRCVGFTGGVGIAEQWSGDGRHPTQWRDTHFELRGPAVDELWATYGHSYAVTTRALPPGWDETPSPAAVQPASSRDGDEPEDQDNHQNNHQDEGIEARLLLARTNSGEEVNEVGMAIHGMIASARRTLRIQTAYFLPRPSVCEALLERLAAGVRVQILLPGPHHDQRVVEVANDDVMIDLVEAGAEIYRYQPSMMHAKILTVDGALCAFGSANLNHRSFGRDEELIYLASSPALCGELDADFDRDLAHCRRVAREELERRGWLRRVASRLLVFLRREM